MVATWSLLGSRVLIAVLLFALGTGGDGEVAELARAAAEHLAARIREVAANVTHARVLQAALDGEVYGAQARSFSVNASLLRRQARLAEEGLVAAAAPSLLSLRDAAAKAQARAAEMYPPAQQQEPASQSGPVADDLGEAMRAQGVDADRLREAGVLREAALDADVKALDPAAAVPTGSVWSPMLKGATVSMASSVVTMPQYCLRVGIPAFGSAFSDASHRGDVAHGVLGGLAPRADEGQYPCLTRRRMMEQQSLDSALPIRCLTRQNARVLTCGSAEELVDAVRFLNASATLDGTLRASLKAPPSVGLLWQRIAFARMGVERSFPAMVWTEGFKDAYERYDPRLQPWFWAAASAPRALVVVLDTGAAMEEFDRRDIALRLVSAVLRSVGPGDLVAFVAARDGAPRVFGCGSGAVQCGAPHETSHGLRLCKSQNQTLEWMLAGATDSFRESSYGLCDLGHGMSLALELIKAEIGGWEQAHATHPRPEVLVVASAHGWAPLDKVRETAEDLGVAVHAVSVGAHGSSYERGWLKRLACGAAGNDGALSHVPYRYIWQQVAGGWYRLAARKYATNERLVAVSALGLSPRRGMPVVTLSAPFYELAPSSSGQEAGAGTARVAGVVAMDIAPGPVLQRIAQKLVEDLEARLRAAQDVVWWSRTHQEPLLQLWAVDASGTVLAHPALPFETHGFTHLRDIEGAEVYEALFGWWRKVAGSLQQGECAGPRLFNTSRIVQRGTSSRGVWRSGRSVQRVAFMIDVGGLVEHLEAVLVFVFGADHTGFALQSGASDMCGTTGQGLVLTKMQPGFPVFPRNATSLVHHYAMKVRPARMGSVHGEQLGEALYGKLGNLTLDSSVFAVSVRGLSAPDSTPATFSASAGTEASKSSALDALTEWLLIVNVTSAGELYPAAPASVPGGGFTEQSVRDVVATSMLDNAWRQTWAQRQRLVDAGVLRSLPAIWRFVSATTASGSFRIFPGVALPEDVEWTDIPAYIRSIEAFDVPVASVAGPYAHPIDGTPTVSVGSVVWEQQAQGACIPAGVVAAEFAYAGFVSATLDMLDECAFVMDRRWCMLLDQHAHVVAVSSSKRTDIQLLLTAAQAGAGLFLGEVEPQLPRALEAAGVLGLVDASVSSIHGGRGTVVSSVALRVSAASAAVVHATSWDGVRCLGNVSFALHPVAGTNAFVVIADGRNSAVTNCGQMTPVSRAGLIADLSLSRAATTTNATARPHNASETQCGATRSRACASCYVSVPAEGESRGEVARAGDSVVGSQSPQWVREVRADEGGGGGGDCVMPTSTLVRAHDGAPGDADTCVWWRRRAGWC